MTITNTTLNNNDIDFLKSLKGKNFETYYCDRFTFNTSAYGIVYFNIAKQSFALTNMLEEMNYFRAKDDNAVFHIKHDIKERKSLLVNVELIKHEINNKIEKIYIVNDTTSLTFDNVEYQYITTMGIVFEVEGGRQFGFERTVDFSEDIFVIIGNDVINKFVPVENNIKDQDPKAKPSCKRDIIEL